MNSFCVKISKISEIKGITILIGWFEGNGKMKIKVSKFVF